ncbi:hypothetical protein TNCV_1941711 [Trichonephila clavipes]|uniref:HAT C-terminal dimerisation domain-containing protein n=1 Tax=Trichonephila clavipes TaxID=2585209 RepID=A0A8X6SBU4_TRICX|nr:hypothetical protein TNCV_1941711 [Trichonephila clavipes]
MLIIIAVGNNTRSISIYLTEQQLCMIMMAKYLKLTLTLSVRELYLPLAYISFLVRLAARRLHESNLFESSSFTFNVVGLIAYHPLSCYLATLDLNTLSNLNIPNFFLELIGNKREFIFPRKTPKKISGKVSYRFVTSLCDELNQDQAPQDINKDEFQLERVRLQAFVATTGLGCKKGLIRSSFLGLLKYIIEPKLEDGLPNIVIMLRIFLTSSIGNASCERSFSKLKLIKNYLR